MIAKAWQRTKSGFRGHGGKQAFWGAVKILMIQRKVEGETGVPLETGDMMELACRATEKVARLASQKEPLPSEDVGKAGSTKKGVERVQGQGRNAQ